MTEADTLVAVKRRSGARSESAALVLAAACLFLLWDTRAVYPLKVLVVFFHELSHGLAAVATGGAIVHIALDPFGGGYCVTRGGNALVALNAGYLGSLAWGALLIMLVARYRVSRGMLMLLGAGMLGVALLWVRPVLGFGFGFTLVAGLVCAVVPQWLPEYVCGFIVRLVGICNCAYAVLDIKSDIIERPELRSDAYLLAELTAVPTVVWGAVWIIVATVVTVALVVHIVKVRSN